MFAPSFNLLPVAPVEFALSLQDKAKMLAQETYTHYRTSILVPCKTSLTKLLIIIIAEFNLSPMTSSSQTTSYGVEPQKVHSGSSRMTF